MAKVVVTFCCIKFAAKNNIAVASNMKIAKEQWFRPGYNGADSLDNRKYACISIPGV